MGLLDDAIREHLQLKLRHGADPAEVARLEHEALSPVPRDRPPRTGAAEPPTPDAPPPAAPVQPTEEYDVAAAHAAESPLANAAAANGRDDPPELLPETPEHDRLWFEQKPPSKFDF